MQELKIGENEDLTQISVWSASVDAKLTEADDEVSRLQKWLDDKKHEEEMIAREDQMKFEVKLHETRLKLQAELQTAKPEGQSTTSESTKGLMAKLPKLVISKFEGSYMDWPRFWSQFSETIDKTNIAPISKFTYLCGLLDSMVKCTVEALAFTAEGYNRAKSILQDRNRRLSNLTLERSWTCHTSQMQTPRR